MRDKAIFDLIVVKSQGRSYTFEVLKKNEIATRVSTERLVDAIVDDLGLHGEYDLYVRIPEGMILDRLGLDTLDAAILLPRDVPVGVIWRRGDQP